MAMDIQELAALVGRTGYLRYGKIDFPVVILAIKTGGWNRTLAEVAPVANGWTLGKDYLRTTYGSEWKDIDSIRGLD